MALVCSFRDNILSLVRLSIRSQFVIVATLEQIAPNVARANHELEVVQASRMNLRLHIGSILKGKVESIFLHVAQMYLLGWRLRIAVGLHVAHAPIAMRHRKHTSLRYWSAWAARIMIVACEDSRMLMLGSKCYTRAMTRSTLLVCIG